MSNDDKPLAPLELYEAKKQTDEKTNSMLMGLIIKDLSELVKDSNSARDKALGGLSEQISLLKNAIEETKDPTLAALVAFNLSVDIGAAAKKIVKRNNPMRLEIETIASELKIKGRKPTPTIVWQKLIERCGWPDSCCINLEYKENGDPIIVWFGTSKQAERLTFENLKERLKRMKKGR